VESPRDGGPVVPRVAGAQHGLKGGGLGWGAGIPVSCRTGSGLGVRHFRGQGSQWLAIQWQSRGGAVGRVSRYSVGLMWLRGREPSRMEQHFCRPMGQVFGRPTVLLLGCGVEKPSPFNFLLLPSISLM
jgi:hypothetical protein